VDLRSRALYRVPEHRYRRAVRSVPRPAVRCALLAIACCCALPATAGATKLRATALLTSDDGQTSANGVPEQAAVSRDGRYVVYASTAGSAIKAVFWRDARRGLTQVVANGNADSQHPEASDDGRYVVFYSAATNLVGGGSAGVYLRDMTAQVTTQIAACPALTAAPVISGDGSTVVFRCGGGVSTYGVATHATTGTGGSGASYAITRDGRYLVYDDGANTFELDLHGGSPVQVASGTLGAPPAISDDGRYVALVSGGEVYERDVQAGSPTPIAPGDSVAMSADGRRVAFSGDTGGGDNVYTHDLGAASPVLVSASPDGVPQGGTHPSISADGRYVAFDSTGTNLIAGLNEQNVGSDVFVRDLSVPTLMLVSSPPGAPTTTADNESTLPLLAPDGRSITFLSKAGDLVSPFHDGNGTANPDLYQRGIKLDPAATIADSTESGTAPVGIDFTATSPNPSLVVDVSWDFGDGQHAHGASLSHTYTAAGTFTVIATITDADGDAASSSRTISIAAATPTVVTPPDTTAPRLTLTAAKTQKLKSVLAHGLRGRIGTDEDCSARMGVRISAATARSLGLGNKATTIGTTKLPVAARVVTGYTVRLTKAARRQIAKHTKLRRIAISLHATGSDAAGNAAKEVVRQVLLTR
jgi:Tol biopolymer transport system component